MPNKELYKNGFRIQSARLYGYDYAWPGYYFVTICTKNRVNYFGDIIKYKMELNDFGQIINKCWLEIPKHFPFIKLGEFIVMPNHIHGLIIITDKWTQNLNNPSGVETQNLASLPLRRPDFASLPINNNYLTNYNKFISQSKNLSSVIRGFKVGVKKHAKSLGIYFNWQARFYEHIIRDKQGLIDISRYIKDNPKNWDNDRNNPLKN